MTYYRPKKSVFVDQEKGNVSLIVAIIFGLVLMSVAYLGQINSVVAKNFELRSVQAALKEKQGANQQAMIALTQARSVGSLEAAAKNLNLVAVEKVGYLRITSDFLALSQNP